MEKEIETKEVVDEKAIVNNIQKLVKNYEQSSLDTRSEYQEIFSAYMGKMDDVQSTPYDVKDSIPAMRTEIAYIKPYIFSGNPEIEIEGVGDEDKAIAKILEKIVNYRIQQSIPQAYEKIESWVHQAVTFGTSIIKVIWKFETRVEKEMVDSVDEETGETIQEEKEYEKVITDEPDFDVPNILDVYYNPIIGEIKDQPCLIFRSALPIETIKANPIYNFQDSEGNFNREKVTAVNGKTDPRNSSGQVATDIPNAQSNADSGMAEVFELVDNDKIQTICGDLVLRNTKHDYECKNAVKFIFEPNTIPNRFAGFGVGSNTLGLNKMHYKLWSQTLQSVKLGNNPMFLYALGMGIDPQEFVSKPAGGIGIDTGGQPLSNFIQALTFPDVKSGAVELLTKMEDERKRASGANDLVQGSTSNETLGQDEIAQTNVSNRFELVQRRFKQALADVADLLIKMELKNLQSVDSPILRIFPQELRQSIYEILINEAKNVKYNVKVKGETTVAQNKNLDAKRQVEIYDLMREILTDKEKRAFGRRMAEMRGIDNIDEIIMETNPVMEQQEQLAQQAPDQMAIGQTLGQAVQDNG